MKNLALIFSFICTAGFAQGKYDFGVNIYPNVTSISTSLVHWRPSFSANLFTERELKTKGASVILGIGYKNTGTRHNGNNLFSPIGADSTVIITTHHDFEVPVLAKYYVFKRLYAIIGGSAVILFSNNSLTNDYLKNEIISRSSSKNIGWGIGLTGNVGCGVDIVKKRDHTIYLQPYATIGKNSQSIGLAIGFKG